MPLFLRRRGLPQALRGIARGAKRGSSATTLRRRQRDDAPTQFVQRARICACGVPADDGSRGRARRLSERLDEAGNGNLLLLEDKADAVNLRCFDQKRRFGIDFLYPVDRYVQGLSAWAVPNRVGDLVPNPIFTDLNPSDDLTNVRDSSLVFFGGIVPATERRMIRLVGQGASQPGATLFLTCHG